ncbi:hypothetical protein HPB52_008447 [Rhipicephalus sanguineus]|uniref:CCHC-type domain-containing protein n=1 Tax=Rhipicephalus sanguineus TaxID=34632 RepID=A0A9D4PAZ8_RHISA|nr:hypothetical protein HPB52_008447 [Rhipicephalus sanguineus]
MDSQHASTAPGAPSAEIEMTDSESPLPFDSTSGRTLDALGPWREVISRRKLKKNIADAVPTPLTQQSTNSPPSKSSSVPETSHQRQQTHQSSSQLPLESSKPRKPPVRRPTPPLPEDHYKVIYRPRTGLKLSNWTDEKISEGIARASGYAFREFCANVITQTQWRQNLIITSTGDEDYALKLAEVTSIQLGTTTYEITPYIKPVPGTVRGVVHGVTPGTTEERLLELLAANDNCTILHARMLGRSSSAVITFEGPHVPFYVKVASSFTRCRPYRKSVQFCKACGNIGHRQDVCPNPDTGVCNKCAKQHVDPNHQCEPTCQLCGLPHETASRECRNKLKPAPPPLHIRERSRSRQKGCAHNPSEPSSSMPPRSRSESYTPSGEPNKRGTSTERKGDQQKLSWAEVAADATHSPTQCKNAAPTSSSRYEEEITTLRRQNEDLKRQLEEQERRAQMREANLERKLDALMQQIEQQQKAPTASPLKHAVNPDALKTLETGFEARLETAMEAMMTKVTAIVQTVVQSLKLEIAQMGEGLSQRVVTLEREKEHARKKPKYPAREAQIQETLGSQNGGDK